MSASNHCKATPTSPHEWEKLQEILVQQFLLHEVQHQIAPSGGTPFQTDTPDAPPALTTPAPSHFPSAAAQQEHPTDASRHPSRPPSSTSATHEPAPDEPRNTWSRQPKAHELVDIYKCLHQGEFGIGHSIGNPVRFRARLEQEVIANPPSDDEPLLEIISMDGTTLRLNLRPFRKRFADDIDRALKGLTDACLESARGRRGEPGHFLKTLFAFRDLNAAGRIKVGKTVYIFDPRSVDRFLIEVKNLARRLGQIPVFGHSETYRQMNAPAYRVIDKEVLKRSPLARFCHP